jgi:fluoride exporter
MEFLIVGLGGFLGALSRYGFYLLESQFAKFTFPIGTLVINLFGCLLAGLLMASIEKSLPVHRNLILFASIGFIGSFTTFSTYSIETFSLIRNEQFLFAAANVLLNTFLGLVAIYLGRLIIIRN